MKTLLTLFVLLFSFPVFADDISDFQIEGMSIGDSLLDYMSEEKILKNQTNYFQHLENYQELYHFFHSLFQKSENIFLWSNIPAKAKAPAGSEIILVS